MRSTAWYFDAQGHLIELFTGSTFDHHAMETATTPRGCAQATRPIPGKARGHDGITEHSTLVHRPPRDLQAGGVTHGTHHHRGAQDRLRHVRGLHVHMLGQFRGKQMSTPLSMEPLPDCTCGTPADLPLWEHAGGCYYHDEALRRAARVGSAAWFPVDSGNSRKSRDTCEHCGCTLEEGTCPWC